MKRLFLNISTTAGVLLLAMGAHSMLESQHYILAGVFLFLAFWLPAHEELDTLIKRRFGMEADAESDSKTVEEVGSEEESR